MPAQPTVSRRPTKNDGRETSGRSGRPGHRHGGSGTSRGLEMKVPTGQPAGSRDRPAKTKTDVALIATADGC
jgi:hypothetical protein